MLSREGQDILVIGEAVNSFRKDYSPPAVAKPYLLDLSQHKLLGLKDWVGAAKLAKPVRDEWQARFQ
jgi:hypothetical protein